MAVLNGQIAIQGININNVDASSVIDVFTNSAINESTSTPSGINSVFNSNIDSLISILNHNTVFNSYYQDYLSSFARFFGVGSYQTTNALVIQKSELPRLTPSVNNHAEALLVGLLTRVMEHESNNLISLVAVNLDSITFIRIDDSPYKRIILSVDIFTLPNIVGREIVNYSTPITPDDL